MTAWLLVFVIVAATAIADILQAWEGRRRGGVHSAGGMGAHLQSPLIILSIVCMAISFFAFLGALSIADMSFVVPASAASIAVETPLAAWVLKERVNTRRWLGALLVVIGVGLVE